MCAAAIGANPTRHKDSKPEPPEERGSSAGVLAEVASNASPNKSYSPIVLGGLVQVIEFLLLASVGFAVHEVHVAPIWGRDVAYFVVIPTMALLAVFSLHVLGLHHVAALRAPAIHGLKILGGWTLVFVGALALLFFLKLDAQFSRVWLAGWYFFGLAALMLERFLLAAAVRGLTRQGKLDRRTAIVGGGRAAEPVLRALAAQDDGDLRIVGVFDDRSDPRSPDVVAGFPRLGTVDDLVEFARHARLDLVIFTLPISAEERLLQMLRKLWVLPVDIRLAAHSNKLRFRPRSYSYVGDVPVIDIFDKPIADWDVLVKAAFDKVVGTLCLIALSPVMLAVAAAVKLDSPGPALFKQSRYGFNNEKIEVYKFRSMFVDQLDAGAKRLVTKTDPRVTRVGRFIRRTSLDELPQLFNVVFKGNLSLVGPRPHAMHA
ncbi:MAG: exopolysaccharide biosynthesis polyprenyl glycosylphosphotransferase, partial [Methylocystis sp.]